jgi:predicted aspartyl protease
MMFGRVNRQREAVLKLVIIGDRDRKVAIDAVVDTGFNGDLILPIKTVLEVELIPQGYQKATLGDATISQYDLVKSNNRLLISRSFDLHKIQ